MLIYLFYMHTPTFADKVTHQECVLLNRVLSDKAKLPPACCAPPAKVQNVSAEAKLSKPEEDRSIGSLVRRFTGAIPGALNSLNPAHASKKGALRTGHCSRSCLSYHMFHSSSIFFTAFGLCSSLLFVRLKQRVVRRNNRYLYSSKTPSTPKVCIDFFSRWLVNLGQSIYINLHVLWSQN